MNVGRHFLGSFMLIDRLLSKKNNKDKDKNKPIKIVYTGSDAFAFSSLRYHNKSINNFHEMWHDLTDRCYFGHGYEYLFCRSLGGNQHAKAKLGNLFHVVALPYLYSHVAGIIIQLVFSLTYLVVIVLSLHSCIHIFEYRLQRGSHQFTTL